MRKLSHEELLARQQGRQAPKLPFSVLLNDIRSLYNVGSVFRTADGLGVEKIWICGITGFPPDPQISKTALDAQESVPWQYERDPCRVLRGLKAAGYRIVLLEQTDASGPYEDFEPAGPVCLVLGNETNGIGEELLSLCDQAVEIGMDGVKNSLNVSVAFGIVASHIRNVLRKKMPA